MKWYHSIFCYITGDPVRETLNLLQRQAVTAAVAIVMKKGQRVCMALGTRITRQMQDINVQKEFH